MFLKCFGGDCVSKISPNRGKLPDDEQVRRALVEAEKQRIAMQEEEQKAKKQMAEYKDMSDKISMGINRTDSEDLKKQLETL